MTEHALNMVMAELKPTGEKHLHKSIVKLWYSNSHISYIQQEHGNKFVSVTIRIMKRFHTYTLHILKIQGVF